MKIASSCGISSIDPGEYHGRGVVRINNDAQGMGNESPRGNCGPLGRRLCGIDKRLNDTGKARREPSAYQIASAALGLASAALE